MKLFRNKSRRLSDGQERFAERVAEWILARQRRVADWLNQKTAHLHPKLWLFLLVIFCAGFGSYLIRLVLQVLN